MDVVQLLPLANDEDEDDGGDDDDGADYVDRSVG